MSELTLEFTGRIPAKKNSRQGIVRKGRVLNLPSKAYEKWEKTELASLVNCPSVPGPVTIAYEFWIGGVDVPALFDLDNSIASINDLLQKAEIISGDDWAMLPAPHPTLRGFVRGPQRVVVTIRTVAATPWLDVLAMLRDADLVKAMAKANKISARAQRDLLWEKLTNMEIAL